MHNICRNITLNALKHYIPSNILVQEHTFYDNDSQYIIFIHAVVVNNLKRKARYKLIPHFCFCSIVVVDVLYLLENLVLFAEEADFVVINWDSFDLN